MSSDITELIQTGVGGAPVTQVYVGDRIYDVTVRFPTDRAQQSGRARRPAADHRQLGAQVPLSQVASITLRNGESTITREMNHRNLTVRIDLADRDIASYLAEVQAEIARTVQFDTASTASNVGGQFENQRAGAGAARC